MPHAVPPALPALLAVSAMTLYSSAIATLVEKGNRKVPKHWLILKYAQRIGLDFVGLQEPHFEKCFDTLTVCEKFLHCGYDLMCNLSPTWGGLVVAECCKPDGNTFVVISGPLSHVAA